MILYRDGGIWALCPYKVLYTQHGEELEQYTNDKAWWTDFADKWEHTEIIAFEDAVHSVAQIARLEDIKNISEGFGGTCSEYVLDGSFPEGREHPLHILQLEIESVAIKKENHMLNSKISALTDQTSILEQALVELAVKVYE